MDTDVSKRDLSFTPSKYANLSHDLVITGAQSRVYSYLHITRAQHLVCFMLFLSKTISQFTTLKIAPPRNRYNDMSTTSRLGCAEGPGVGRRYGKDVGQIATK